MAVNLFSSMASLMSQAGVVHQGTTTPCIRVPRDTASGYQKTVYLEPKPNTQCMVGSAKDVSVSLVVAPAVCICPGGNITACMTADGLASTHAAFHTVAVKELPFASHRCATSAWASYMWLATHCLAMSYVSVLLDLLHELCWSHSRH